MVSNNGLILRITFIKYTKELAINVRSLSLFIPRSTDIIEGSRKTIKLISKL